MMQRLVPPPDLRDMTGAEREWSVEQVRVFPSAAAIRQAEAAMEDDDED